MSAEPIGLDADRCPAGPFSVHHWHDVSTQPTRSRTAITERCCHCKQRRVRELPQ